MIRPVDWKRGVSIALTLVLCVIVLPWLFMAPISLMLPASLRADSGTGEAFVAYFMTMLVIGNALVIPISIVFAFILRRRKKTDSSILLQIVPLVIFIALLVMGAMGL